MSTSPTNRRPSLQYDSTLSPSANSFQPGGGQPMSQSQSHQGPGGRGAGRAGAAGRGGFFNPNVLQQIQSQISPSNPHPQNPQRSTSGPSNPHQQFGFQPSQPMPQIPIQQQQQQMMRSGSFNSSQGGGGQSLPQPFYPQTQPQPHPGHQQQPSLSHTQMMNLNMNFGGGQGLPSPTAHVTRPSLSMAMPSPGGMNLNGNGGRNPSFNMLSPGVQGMASPIPIHQPPSPLGNGGGMNQTFQFGGQNPSPQRNGSLTFGTGSTMGTSPNGGTSPGYINRQASYSSTGGGMPLSAGLLPPSNGSVFGGPPSSASSETGNLDNRSENGSNFGGGPGGGRKKKNRGSIGGNGPVHTPLKTTGHNSTPSVSIMNPAAFAASLGLGGKVGAASGSKKKVLVKLPKEQSDEADKELVDTFVPVDDYITAETEDAKEETKEEKEEKEEKKRKKKNFLMSKTRLNWKPREPFQSLEESQNTLPFNYQDVSSTSTSLLPSLPTDLTQFEEGENGFSSFVSSREVYPQRETNVNEESSLPDTIDIYLPGKSAWDEYRVFRQEEKLEEEFRKREEERRRDAGEDESQEGERTETSWGVGKVGDGATFGIGHPHGRSLSISSPADPNIVSQKLSRYLQSQSAITSGQPFSASDDSSMVSSRFQDHLPPQLREAAMARFSRSQQEKNSVSAPNSATFPSHGYTMSLGLPSSGGPFGPAALSALGLGANEMARSGSDQGESHPALGMRPIMERGHSIDGSVSLTSSNPQPVNNDDATAGGRPALTDLARGFGYDIEEVDEDNLSSAHHSRNPSANNVENYIGAKRIERHLAVPNEDDEEDEDVDEADLRTNPSEDGDDESDIDDLETSPRQKQRGGRHTQGISTAGMSDFGGKRNVTESYDDDYEESQISFSDNSDDEDIGDSTLDSTGFATPRTDDYSNPSDLETARELHREEKNLKLEKRAAEKIRRNREKSKNKEREREERRNRAYTGETLASSNIGVDDWNWQANQRRTGIAQNGNQQDFRRGSNLDEDDEIISNPSDEEEDERLEKDTFGGGSADEPGDRDFSFPRNRQSGAPAPSSSAGLHAATLGRTAGRRTNGTQEPQSAHDADINPHFRLPSIHNSSFGGSSAFGGLAGNSNGAGGTTQLKATAPSFTPTGFTFTAPGGAPRLPQLPQVEKEHGREKRFRHEGWVNPTGEGGTEIPVDDVAETHTGLASPPRPVGSAASIEGPQRGFGANTNPPPFDVSGPRNLSFSSQSPQNQQHHQFGPDLQPPQSNFSFKPDAPVFTPTMGRATSGAGSSRRAAIPDFGFGPVAAAAEQPRSSVSNPAPFGNASSNAGISGVPASDFTFVAPGSKAIPIKKPEEVQDQDDDDPMEGGRGGKHARRDLDHSPHQGAKGKENSLVSSPNKLHGSLSGSAALRAGMARKPLNSVFERKNLSNQPDPSSNYGVSPPVTIPGRSETHQQQVTSLSQPYEGRGHVHGDSASSSVAFDHPHARRNRGDVRNAMNAMNARMSGESNGGDDDEDEDDDDEEVEDIIEELADRMDKALEGWAGKILDEVTIMGQVRPPSGPLSASTFTRIDPQERDILISAFGNHVQSTFEDYFEKFSQKVAAIQPTVSTSSSAENLADESQRTIKAIEDRESSATTPSAKASAGHAPLDGQGELDFDYVTEVLDSKIANLKRELMAAFDTALPKAFESIPRDVSPRHAIEAAPIPPAPQPHPALEEPRPTELSESASEKLVQLVVARLQPIVEKASELAERAAGQKRQAELTQTLEPMLEENLLRAQTKAAAERQETTHLLAESLSSRFESWERNLGEMRSALDDQMQVALVKGIFPLLETLRQEPTDPDVVAARVTEILLPMMADRRERDELERRDSSDTLANLSKTSSLSSEQFADLTVDKLTPIINSIKSEPIDMDAIVARVGEIVGKQSIEHLVDLDPVIALLEPLVTKQEEARSISKQIMERQREVESTLAVLPGAINAKTEVFLSATQQTHEKQASILEQLEKMVRLHESTQHRADELDEQRDDLLRQLDAARQESHDRKADADEAKAELSAASGYSSSLKEELTRLEIKSEEAQKDAEQISSDISELRLREAAAKDRAHEAERKILEMESTAKESQIVNDASEAQRSMLQTHIDQLTSELNEARAERARERESAAQATAEALARADRAEKAAQESRLRADERTDEARKIERVAQEEVKTMAERAAKAEGELTSLEKRLADQDHKVTTLQQVNATQKQKAAQSQQRLSEAEKKTKDFDQINEELANARGRMQELESRGAERDQLDERLRASQDSELRLREELATYHTRFLELEKDLITMKESLVGRDELEACQAELASSREEVARLDGQLAERERERPQPLNSKRKSEFLDYPDQHQKHLQEQYYLEAQEEDNGERSDVDEFNQYQSHQSQPSMQRLYSMEGSSASQYASRYASHGVHVGDSYRDLRDPRILGGITNDYYDFSEEEDPRRMKRTSMSSRGGSVLSNSTNQRAAAAQRDDGGWWS